MKSKKSIQGRLLIIAIATIFLFTASNSYSASITFMLGKVKVIRDGKKFSADMDKKLESGDMIRTGKGGMAVVSYDDGSEMKIQENSWVKIGNKAKEDSEFVSLLSGVLKAKFAKVRKGQTRKVYTPTTVCSVRGTDFLVGVSEGADSQVQLTEGKLDVSNPYGKTKLKQNQKVDVGVAKSPKKSKGYELSMEDLMNWKSESNKELQNNPETKSKSFDAYIKKFGKRSKTASKDISKLRKKQKKSSKLGKKGIKKAGQEIEDVENDIEDDMFLSAAANNSIDGILNRFQQDKKNMYNTFLRIKKESNRVLEQQKKNYEAIQAVKAAYKKAYDEIKGKHKSQMDKIKGSIDMDQYKPKK